VFIPFILRLINTISARSHSMLIKSNAPAH
jgi:hypothetical protein